MPYTVMMTETFEKEFSSHHRDRKDLLRKIIRKLEEEPQSGKPLRGKLHGLWQLRSGPFRIW